MTVRDRTYLLKEMTRTINEADSTAAYCLCQTWILEKALQLLKEHEPHVLTIDQLEDALDTVVWLDMPGAENLADGYALIMAYSHKHECMFFDSPFGDSPSQDRLEYSEYGRSWRCWDRRPLEEQRKAVKWE